jgi:hypothetical protein
MKTFITYFSVHFASRFTDFWTALYINTHHNFGLEKLYTAGMTRSITALGHPIVIYQPRRYERIVKWNER